MLNFYESEFEIGHAYNIVMQIVEQSLCSGPYEYLDHTRMVMTIWVYTRMVGVINTLLQFTLNTSKLFIWYDRSLVNFTT